jgi:hypothetical protein
MFHVQSIRSCKYLSMSSTQVMNANAPPCGTVRLLQLEKRERAFSHRPCSSSDCCRTSPAQPHALLPLPARQIQTTVCSSAATSIRFSTANNKSPMRGRAQTRALHVQTLRALLQDAKAAIAFSAFRPAFELLLLLYLSVEFCLVVNRRRSASDSEPTAQQIRSLFLLLKLPNWLEGHHLALLHLVHAKY